MSWIFRWSTAAAGGWIVLVFGLIFAVYSGHAEPYISPTTLPVGPDFIFGGAIVVVVAGVSVIVVLDRRTQKRRWLQAGGLANLTPGGDKTQSGKPELTGTVRGRPVRARLVKRKRLPDADRGSYSVTVTVVETDLDRPSRQGLIIGIDGGVIESSHGRIHIVAEADTIEDAGLAVHQDGDLMVVSNDEAVARAVTSGPSGAALLSLDADLVYAGDATGLLNTYLRNPFPEGSSGWQRLATDMGKLMRSPGMFDESIPGDASTVSIEAEEVITDGSRLRDWTETVVKIAGTYEKATNKS